MYQIEEDIQTVHLYVVPEEEYVEPISVGHIINGLLCGVCAVLLLLLPSSRDIGPYTLMVPLQLLPVQQFIATVPIQPTGTRVIPATNARGWLTMYNGSILVQQLPAGFVVEAQGGQEIVVDHGVTIPAGDPPAYGVARVSARVVSAGRDGNIPALSINAVLGTSLYLKNLTAFTGGADERSERYATEADKQAALSRGRSILRQSAKTPPNTLIQRPCDEAIMQNDVTVNVSWSCQFARYIVPRGLQVISAERVGMSMKLEVKQ